MSDITTEEQILIDAVDKTGQAYQESPTVVNLREWNAAKAALEKYRKALTETTEGQRFRSIAEVARFLIRQGYKVQERTLRNHHKSGLFPVHVGGEFRQQDIEAYAEKNLKRPGYEGQGTGGTPTAKDRLAEAMADGKELDNKKKRGELIDAAEEEARDAKLWRAVRADIENYAPAIITELVERVLSCDPPEELRHRITTLIPELRVTYEDFIAEMFDRYARDGGVAVETA
jgi:hypothetical protein